MKKNILDIFLFIIAIFFIFFGFNFLKRKNTEIHVKCKNINLKVNDNLNIPSLKRYSVYNSTIMGKLFPYNNSTVETKTNLNINFYLMGTAIIGDKKSAIFYFKKDRRCFPYTVGDEIEGWKIDDILKGEVVLSANGKKNNLQITDQRFSCSKMRLTQNTVSSNTIILGSNTGSSKNNIKKNITKKVDRTNNIKKTYNKKIVPKRPHIIRPTKEKPIRNINNPFIELLKRIKKNPKKPSSNVKNPFLEIIKRQQNR